MFHRVCEYAHISLTEAKNLPGDEFMLYFRNSIIQQLMKSEEGRELLGDWKRDLVDEDENGVDDLQSMLGEEVEYG